MELDMQKGGPSPASLDGVLSGLQFDPSTENTPCLVLKYGDVVANACFKVETQATIAQALVERYGVQAHETPAAVIERMIKVANMTDVSRFTACNANAVSALIGHDRSIFSVHLSRAMAAGRWHPKGTPYPLKSTPGSFYILETQVIPFYRGSPETILRIASTVLAQARSHGG